MPAHFLLAIGGHTRQVTSIDEALFLRAKNAMHVLQAIHTVELRYENVIENYISLETASANLLLTHTMHSDRIFDPTVETHGEIARFLNNLLTSASGYQAQAIRYRIGNDRTAVKKLFDARKSSSAHFRAAQQLRNHDQHFSIAVHQWSLPSSWTDDRGKLRHGFQFAVDVSRLARDRKMKSQDLEELRQMSDKDGYISVPALIRAYLEDLSYIHHELRKCMKADLNFARASVAEVLEIVEALGAEPNAGASLHCAKSEESQDIEKFYVTNKMGIAIEALEKRNKTPLINFRLVEFYL